MRGHGDNDGSQPTSAAPPPHTRLAVQRGLGDRGNPVTGWTMDPRMARAKMAGDRGDARSGLWPQDRGVGT